MRAALLSSHTRTNDDPRKMRPQEKKINKGEEKVLDGDKNRKDSGDDNNAANEAKQQPLGVARINDWGTQRDGKRLFKDPVNE